METDDTSENVREVFTAGLARIEHVQSGSEECSALCLTSELATNMKRAIVYQRKLLKEKSRIERQRVEIRRFRDLLQREISEKTISMNEATIEQTERGWTMPEEVDAWRKDLEVMKSVEQDMQVDMKQADMQESYWVEELQEMASYVLTALDEIFVDAGMIDPGVSEDDPIEVYDWDNELQKASERLNPPLPPRLTTPKPMTDAERTAAELWHEVVVPYAHAMRDWEDTKAELDLLRRIREETLRTFIQGEHDNRSREEVEGEWTSDIEDVKLDLNAAEKMAAIKRAIAEEAGYVFEEEHSLGSRNEEPTEFPALER